MGTRGARILLGLLALGTPATAEQLTVESARQILDRSFSLVYVSNLVRVADLEVSNSSSDALRYRVQLASKGIGGRYHSYGIFTQPARLRNLTILSIEADSRTDDHFLYLPSSGRVRRISSAQRNDSFMGTDLTYEDFERRRVDDYTVDSALLGEVEGEGTVVIRATPKFRSNVHRVEFEVAEADDSLLVVRSFKAGAIEPFRILRAPRESIEVIDGHPLPSQLIIENHSRRTVTTVVFAQQHIEEGLSEGLFSSTNLELRRTIPGLPQ